MEILFEILYEKDIWWHIYRIEILIVKETIKGKNKKFWDYEKN